ncbi:MAG: HD domain-containing protein [Desulfobacteraceae bacterium]|nr:HD domain-containing protein [Desulfobacteraceae bacterium]
MFRQKEKTEDAVMDLIKQKGRLDLREIEFLYSHGTLSRSGIRRRFDKNDATEYRQSFSLDVDRILHSLAYTRYIDKTQVFYLIENDHITHRVLHVQLLSKIARTIGRFLGLNEDLIEAISLGHDVGHPPFGHEGERILSNLCRDHGIGHFAHSVQSLQCLDEVERSGNGWNLCLQTLDGILCHDGEIHNQTLSPHLNKTFEDLDEERKKKTMDPQCPLAPMTLEGCVVRMADTISYIGRDLEDAIRLNLVKRSEFPEESVKCLGDTNGSIVYNLVTDVIQASYEKPHIAFSPEVSEALKNLKQFNMERIYMNPRIKQHLGNISVLFEMLFERFGNDMETGEGESVIFTGFLKGKSLRYKEKHSNAEIVRDFIAGMTDRYFLNLCPENLRPGLIIL